MGYSGTMPRNTAALLLTSLLGADATGGDLIRTTWGVPRFDDPSEWLPWMTELKAGGYAGVESPTWLVCGVPTFSSFGVGGHYCNATRADIFRAALNASGLYYVAQVHTCGYPISCSSVDDHARSLEALVATARDDLGASLGNVHGGVDFWGLADRLDFFGRAQEAEARLGLPLAHETHRMRALGSPFATLELLDAWPVDSPALTFTADLSHWVVAAERLMDFPADAAWWPRLLGRVSATTELVHARVGSPREIQVGDPSAPEHAAALGAYEAWWGEIFRAAAARGRRIRVEAEFGPAPYMPSLPFTRAPVADLEAAVDFVGRRQMKRLESVECEGPGRGGE